MTLDYDLVSALNLAGVARESAGDPLAVWTGENDGEEWRWLLPMTDGRFALLEGWCDYTGWDCQAGAAVSYGDTAEAAAALVEVAGVRAELERQLTEGLAETPCERIGRDLGLS